MANEASGHYGALRVPALARLPGEAAGDPGLSLVGAYLQAFLNTYAGDLWASVAPGSAPGHPAVPVKKVFTHDPREVALSEHDFPSLYLFRTGGDPPEQIAEDWRITTDTLAVLWIFPREGSQEAARTRRPFAAALAKLIDKAIHRMRDPCFVVPGDPDPAAVDFGSNLFRIARILELAPAGRWEIAAVTVNGEDGGTGDRAGPTYRAILYPMTIRERDNQAGSPDLDAPLSGYAPQASWPGQPPDPSALADYDTPFGVDVSITTPDGAVVTAGYQK